MIRRLLILFLVLSGLLGCETDDLVSPSDYGGWIEGEVTDGGLDDLGGRWIEVDHIAWDGTVTDYRTRTDDDGYYRIGVPNGRAVVSARGAGTLYFSQDGVTYVRSEADTLLIDGLATRADFRCGRLQVVVPDGLDHLATWRWLEIVIPIEGGYYSTSEPYRPIDGALVAEVRRMPPGRFTLLSRGQDQGSCFYLPGSYRLADADSVDVGAGLLTSYMAATPDPVTISGSVLGSWQVLGFDPPEVEVYSREANRILDVTCDEQGWFEAVLPAGGDFQIEVLFRDRGDIWRTFSRWVGGAGRDSARIFSLEGGQSEDGIQLVEGGLELSLPDDPSRTCTQITIYDAEGAGLGHLTYDAAEPVRMAGLAPGWYRVHVTTDGQSIPAYHDGSLGFEEAAAVQVRAGEVTAVPVVLVEGGQISGRLVAPGGGALTVPFTFAVVQVPDWFWPMRQYASDEEQPRGFDYDPATGDFRISLLPDGAYCLRVLHDPSGWSWYPSVPDPEQSTHLVIEDGGEVADLVWQL